MAGQLSFDVGDDDRRGYRGPDVADLVGISYRQLDHWTRTDLVRASVREASGSGTQRLYGFRDVLELRVIKRLLDAGISLQKVRTAFEAVREEGRDIAEVTLASNGGSVLLFDEDESVVDLLKRGQGVFAIAVQPVADELRGQVTQLTPEMVVPAPVGALESVADEGVAAV